MKIGPKTYIIRIRLVDQAGLKKVPCIGVGLEPGDTLDGLWVNDLGMGKIAGTIYIHKSLSVRKQRQTYDHEMRHAVHDILEWDSEH
jgi:hypothetical protein